MPSESRGEYKNNESAEQLKRAKENLEVLRDVHWHPEIYQKADAIIEKGENTILDLLRSPDSNDKYPAIYATVCLVEVNVGEENERLVNLADALLDNIENSDIEIAKLASRAVIYLILNSKTFALKMLGKAFDVADKWCNQNKHDGLHRVEPWLLYRDLALFTATRFFERVDNFFDHIFIAIRDSKIVVREHAAQALHAALAVTSQREAKQKNVWYEDCFKKACEQVRNLSKDDSLHASLLLFNELLRIASVEAEQQRLQIISSTSSATSGSLIGRNPILWLQDPGYPAIVESRTAHSLVTENYYAEIIERCMLARSSKSKNCQTVLLEILPRIATITPLTEQQLNDFVDHALNLTSKYPQAFLSFGLLSLNQPKQLAPKALKYLSILAQQIKEATQKRKQINSLLFKSLCLVVRSQREALCDEIQRMLPLLLSTGLSEGLTEVFEETVQCIPALKTDVLDGLMEQLYQLLMNRQLPSKLAPPTAPPVPNGPIQVTNVELTKLALKTLGSFEFQRHALQMFMRYIALGYLTSNEIEIQIAAVHCCVSIVKPFIKVYSEVEDTKKLEVYSLIRSVLDCLIKTAITDPNVRVRLCVLNCFRSADHDFLVHLAQQETLDSLFMILNDEKFEMQEAAGGLLAQLSDLNPALILPKLRKLLNEKIYVLASSRVAKLEEHSAKIIINLAVHAPKFVSLFMKSLLMVLVPHLSNNEAKNIDVTINVLNAITELALIGGLDVVKITSKLVPILITCLKDSSSLQRREAALRALGNLCQSSAYVIEPYKDHPELLGLFLRLLKTELSFSMHRLTMKVFGVIGALDPYMYKIYIGAVHSYASKPLALSLPQLPANYDYKKDGTDIIQWINFERCTLAEYYPTLAIINLVRMLHDNALSNLYQQIIEAIMVIFKSLGQRSSLYVNQVIPQMIQILESCKPDRREFFLNQFGILASIIRQQLQPYIKSIFELIHKAWKWNSSSNLRSIAVYVMKEIGGALGLEFTPYVGDLCPYLLEIVETERVSERPRNELIMNTMACIRAIVPCLSGHIHVVLPAVLTVLDMDVLKTNARREAVDTLILIARNHNISDRAASMMQTWLRCAREKQLQEQLVTLLMLLMSQMWTQYAVYVERVKDVMEKYKFNGVLQEEYKQLLAQIINNPQNPPADNLIPTVGRRIPICSIPGTSSGYGSSGGMPRQIAQKEASPSELLPRVNVKELRTAWRAPGFTTRDDWIEWLVNLRKQFLTYSPSPALNACSKLAFHHPSLATELFNAAFISVWTHLSEGEQDELTAQLVDVIAMCKTTPEPIQAILNLAEFLDHSEKGPLPINYTTLMECAEITRAYAKALRYNELNINNKKVPTAEDCQTIITFANKLNLEEMSIGIVQYAEKNNMTISGRWYEKLGEWEKALDMYSMDESEKSEKVTKTDEMDSNEDDEGDETMIHQMRCIEALGRWSDLNKLSESALKCGLFNPEDSSFKWPDVDKRQKIAQMSARGYWAVGNYEQMSAFVDKINANNTDGSFLRAVLSIRNNRFSEATKYINRVRDMLDSELTSMAAESYERAYGAVVSAQMLTELEEAIEYKMIPERRTRIAILWSRRLQGCRKNIEHWQRILLVRSLVLSQSELRPMWVKFASLCRREGKTSMSRRVLCSLLDLPNEETLKSVDIPLDKPFLALAICKQNWADGDTRGAYKSAQELALSLLSLIRNSGLSKSQLEPLKHLTAKCYMKLGDWFAHSGMLPQNTVRTRNPSKHPHAQKPTLEQLSYMNQTEFNNLEQITKITLQHYNNATAFDPNWYKAWHKLGTMYYNFVMSERQLMFGSMVDPGMQQAPSGFEPGMVQSGMFGELPTTSAYHPMAPSSIAKNPQVITSYAVNGVKCFVKAIQLAEGSRVEDTLRLLMIWFDHCEKPEVFEQLRDLIKTIPVDTWLEVVPQLMGRMDSTKNVGILVEQVVTDIAKAHPQAIVYALTAATKSKNAQRCKVARKILRLMAEERPKFVEQACMLSEEFIRCAILWHEMWHGTLEDASRLYFQEKNFEGMMKALQPLHERIEAGHTTMKEESFNQTYYRELKEALEHCLEFNRTANQKEITQAWDLYYKVFKRISNQLRSMSALDLNYISPQLLKAQNLEVSVPGTYDPSSPLITIASIVPHLEVITSKQRPRKISIRGSDGCEYTFLLKGNEDPRQDERIMQLFGLINHLILRDPDTNRRNLSIQRYSIIPLSQTSGLIGWVPNCDTLHTLIRDYREKHKIPVSIEHTNMQKLVIDIEKLTLLQKVEIFDEVLKTTQGDDLKFTLWAQSPNSESWFDRRTNYTRSIATSSMVGYILGLGDRHPSNLMLDRLSGKIVHIDFGDCFEVAMKRIKFPEKIPFRLTRMLVRAMEVTGIEGNYRLTCERVLRLLRSNNDSILAVLEAFVYDPVLNWRLTESSARKPTGFAERVGPEADEQQQQLTGSHSDAISRVKAKLTGRDFNVFEEIGVQEQVNRLIEQATLYDNLCQCYIGWCPFW